MKLSGRQVGEFVVVLCDAFDRNELAILTRTALDQDLKVIVADGALQSVAFDLVKWVEERGLTAELLHAVRAARPRNPRVTGFADPLLAAAGAGGTAGEQRQAAAFNVAELQAVSNATRIMAEVAAHGSPPTAAEVAAITSRAVEAVASAAVPVPTVADHVVNEIRESIADAVEEWKRGMGSANPIDWQRVTDRFRANTCQLLGIARQLCGGQLPDDLLKLWADNRCG